MANEKRLIDANEILLALINAAILLGKGKSDWYTGYRDGLFAAKEMLDNAAVVDAVEVVHGRWLDVQETDMYVPDMKFTITKTAETCSECKARIGFVGAKRYLFDSVCPNCGAKMDGDGNDTATDKT